MGPFYFGCGAQATIRKIFSKFTNKIDILGYLDDNTVIVKRSIASEVYDYIDSKFQLIGLKINPGKSSIFGSEESLNFIKNQHSNLSQIESTSSEFLSVLGVPLGSNDRVKQELKKSIDDYVKVLPLLVKLSPKIVYYLLKFCVNARPMFVLRTSAPWLTKSAIEYFDSLVDNGILALSSWTDSKTAFQNFNTVEELRLLPHLTDVTKLVRSISIGGGGAGIRRGSDVSNSAYLASFMTSWQYILCQGNMTHFVHFLKSNTTPFIQKHVDLIQKLELKYQNEKVDNSNLLWQYLSDKASTTPSQKVLTIEVEKKLIVDLKALLEAQERLPALATFLSNQPNETSMWLKHPFQTQSLLNLDDDEFVLNFRTRILIENFSRLVNERRQCKCGTILFAGLDEYHYLTCKSAGGPCSDRTSRHNEIRDELAIMLRKFYPEGRVRREEFIPDPIVEGTEQRKADATIHGINIESNEYFDVSVTSPATFRVCKKLRTYLKQLAAALGREQGKLYVYGITFGEAFKVKLTPVVFEVSGAHGMRVKQLLDKLNKIARKAGDRDPNEKLRLLNAIQWFKFRVNIICAKYTAKLIAFHALIVDSLVPIDARVYEDEAIAADPFNDQFVNEPDLIVEVVNNEIIDGA